MLRVIKSALILILTVGLTACGYDYDWMKGEFAGTTRVTRIDGTTRLENVSSGEGRINFKIPFYARLGGGTPLPDCNVQFASETEPDKYFLTDVGSEYRGESNDGKGCQARLGTSGETVPIEIYRGKMRREPDGLMVMNLEFRVKGATGTGGQYEFEFRGSKKGWF